MNGDESTVEVFLDSPAAASCVEEGGHGGPPLVRLRACMVRGVKVPSGHALSGL